MTRTPTISATITLLVMTGILAGTAILAPIGAKDDPEPEGNQSDVGDRCVVGCSVGLAVVIPQSAQPKSPENTANLDL